MKGWRLPLSREATEVVKEEGASSQVGESRGNQHGGAGQYIPRAFVSAWAAVLKGMVKPNPHTCPLILW